MSADIDDFTPEEMAGLRHHLPDFTMEVDGHLLPTHTKTELVHLISRFPSSFPPAVRDYATGAPSEAQLIKPAHVSLTEWSRFPSMQKDQRNWPVG